MTLEQYLEAEGKGEEEFEERAAHRRRATPSRPSSCSTPSPTREELGRQRRRAHRPGRAPRAARRRVARPVRPAVVQSGQLPGPGGRGAPRQGARHRHGGRDDHRRVRQRRRPRGRCATTSCRPGPTTPSSTTRAGRSTPTPTAPSTTSTRADPARPRRPARSAGGLRRRRNGRRARDCLSVRGVSVAVRHHCRQAARRWTRRSRGRTSHDPDRPLVPALVVPTLGVATPRPRPCARPAAETWASTPRSSTACCASASSSSARRSWTTWPTPSARSCCCSPPRTPSATSCSTSTAPAARSRPAWRSTTRCSSSPTTSRPSASGLAASMGQFLLCAGAKGKRYATPHARIMMHQPSGGIGGTAADIAIQAEQMLYVKKQMAERIAFHTGQTHGADREGLRPRPLVLGGGGQGLRLHRPRHHRRQGRPVRRRHPGLGGPRP